MEKASKRSANICSECRARKVKCDGRRDTCGPCEKLNLGCSFHPGGGQINDTTPERRRARYACEACHALKARCTGEHPSCKRCRTKGVPCSYPSGSRTIGRRHPSRPTATPERQQRSFQASHSPSVEEVAVFSTPPDDDLVMRMFEAFFTHVHPIPVYSFLHRGSLVQRFEARLLDTSLILAIVGLTCTLLDMGQGMKQYGSRCIKQAEAIVMKEIGRPSVIKIQTLVFIIRHHLLQGAYSSGFMLSGTAIRAAYALRLNYEAPHLCFLAQESRRRLMWSLYLMDTLLAGGIRELELCAAYSLHIQLPCQERNFEFDLRQETEALQPKPNTPMSESIGSLAMYIRLMWLRQRILKTTKEAILFGGANIEHLPSQMESLAGELDDFGASLPPSFQFSTKNLQLRVFSPRICPFMLIHIFWRQCYCDLYRVVLVGLAEALRPEQIDKLDTTFVRSSRKKCAENAVALGQVFESFALLKNGCPTMELEPLASSYQCVRLLYHCFRYYGDEVGLTEELTNNLAHQCGNAVKGIPLSCLSGDRMKRDLEALIARGCSSGTYASLPASPSPSGDRFTAPENTGVTVASHQLFSRHSLVKQMVILDDSADLTMPVQKQGASTNAMQPVSSTVSEDEPMTFALPDKNTSNFDISNAFEGAWDDWDVDVDPAAFDPFAWFTSSEALPYDFEDPGN